MYSAANNAICEISLSSHQLTQLIGPANLLQFDIVKDKIEEKKNRNSEEEFSYLLSQLKAQEKHFGERRDNRKPN